MWMEILWVNVDFPVNMITKYAIIVGKEKQRIELNQAKTCFPVSLSFLIISPSNVDDKSPWKT